MTDESGPRRVVIVGGGFAGLFAVRRLKHSNVSVTLIDRAQHHVFQPLLYQCATGIMSEGKIAAPLRDLLKKHKNVDCVMAEVTDFDTAGRRVIATRVGGARLEYGYDDLIVAAGVRQSYFGHDEFARWAPGMKTISDALAIRRRVYGAFEMADTATDPRERQSWLTFALVGAGPTGVELAGQIREVATKTLRAEFRGISLGCAGAAVRRRQSAAGHVRPETSRRPTRPFGHSASSSIWAASSPTSTRPGYSSVIMLASRPATTRTCCGR
jgi:NADH dehydrogenase